MLELRPTCEHCNRDLPPGSTEAMICSFECTFCMQCVERVLENVCPNCGGGFSPRPARPVRDLKNGNNTTKYPASTNVKHRPVDADTQREFAKNIKHVPPHAR